jgi:uncharacterized protein (DUF58 family)
MRGSFFLLCGLIFSLVLVGLVSLQGIVLTLAIPLVVYLVAGLLYSPDQVSLTATRYLSNERVSEGKSIAVKVTVTNTGSSLEELLVTDPLPSGLDRTEGDNWILAPLPAGETLELNYTVQAQRGDFELSEVQALTGETLGLFWEKARLPTPGHLSVRPLFHTVRPIKIRPPQTRGFSGPIPARQAGTGIDFFLVREYQSGDPQRKINWKVAARHADQLFTNLFEQERVADVGLILDSRQQSNIVTRQGALFEHSVRAAASLTERFLKDGNRVGLLVYGGIIRRVFPGYGKVQRERILQALAKARTGHNYAMEDLRNLPTRFFPSHSQVVLISPLLELDVPVLIQFRARGYALMIVSPDPLDFEAGGMPSHARTAYAYRLAHLERNHSLQQLRRVGVQVVDWKVSESLEQAIQETLARQPIPLQLGRKIVL